MAAPLPTGASIGVLPVAPNIGDPRNFAMDTQGALASAHAGLLLGQEMANLDNLQAKRELEAAQIKYLKSKNDLDFHILEATRAQLPTLAGLHVQTEIEKTNAAKLQAQEAGALASANLANQLPAATSSAALAKVQLDQKQSQFGDTIFTERLRLGTAPKTVAVENATLDAAKQEALNKGASAVADAPLAGKDAATRALTMAQANAAGQAMGSMLIAPNGSGALAGSSAFAVPADVQQGIVNNKLAELQGLTTREVPDTDPVTGASVVRLVTYDRLGNIRSTSAPISTAKPGSEQKSVMTQVKEATSVVQALQLARSLEQELLPYIKENQGGALQAVATKAANLDVSLNPLTMGAKGLGNVFQTPRTRSLVSKIENLNSTITHELFGSQVTGKENERANRMLPSSGDILDPSAAYTKLMGTVKMLEDKLSALPPGVLDKSGLSASIPVFQKDLGSSKIPADVMQRLQRGEAVYLKSAGNTPFKLSKDASGKPVLVPVQ